MKFLLIDVTFVRVLNKKLIRWGQQRSSTSLPPTDPWKSGAKGQTREAKLPERKESLIRNCRLIDADTVFSQISGLMVLS